MSRIEAGRMTLALEDLVLDDLVDESIRIVQAQADARNIKVVTDVGKNLRMRGDRKAIKQIMLNLLSNAVKFTLEGEITIRARTTGTAVTFSVEDTGIGIPTDALAKLGRPFEQVSNQFTKSHQGSGLGLAITTSLAELHGGAIRIRSREGQGTIVSVRLPVNPPAGQEPGAA
jgi:two-component system cell cycle sensor histidine kinase PleC